MLVHEVMSTRLVTAKKTDTVRSAVMKMMHRHCGAIPVVEGDTWKMVSVALAISAAFSAWAKAVSLAALKSEG